MKKFIIPLVIILVSILSIIIINSLNNNDQPIDTPPEIQTDINENNEQLEEQVELIDVYEQYNIKPGSYEAYLLDQYSGDESFSFDDLDGDGIPDAIFKEVPEAKPEEAPIL